MSNNLDTWEDVDRYAAEHGGVEPLRMMLYQGRLAERRRALVEWYLRNHDAAALANQREDQARRSLELAERATAAAEKSAAVAERSAVATERAAAAAENSARFAMWAVVVAVVAIVVTMAFQFRQHSP